MLSRNFSAGQTGVSAAGLGTYAVPNLVSSCPVLCLSCCTHRVQDRGQEPRKTKSCGRRPTLNILAVKNWTPSADQACRCPANLCPEERELHAVLLLSQAAQELGGHLALSALSPGLLAALASKEMNHHAK